VRPDQPARRREADVGPVHEGIEGRADRLDDPLARPLVRLLQPPEPPLELDLYDRESVLRGPEIVEALHGHDGFDKKQSREQRKKRSGPKPGEKSDEDPASGSGTSKDADAVADDRDDTATEEGKTA